VSPVEFTYSDVNVGKDYTRFGAEIWRVMFDLHFGGDTYKVGYINEYGEYGERSLSIRYTEDGLDLTDEDSWGEPDENGDLPSMPKVIAALHDGDPDYLSFDLFSDWVDETLIDPATSAAYDAEKAALTALNGSAGTGTLHA
jgi:hypothetical protein